MSNPNSGNIPKFPDPGKSYKSGIEMYLKYLPVELQQELAYRAQYDPQFIEQQLGLQRTYDPQVAKEQMAALQRRDPEWLAMHRGLGDKISQALERGYLDPRQEAAYAAWAGKAGKLDPEQAAAYHKLAGLAGTVDPQYQAAYGALGKQVTGDELRGGTMSPEVLRQTTQAIMARQPSLSYGEAQNMALGVATGLRGEQLKQTRNQATGAFLQQRDPNTMRQQSLGSFYAMPSLAQQQQASLGQFYGAAPPVGQALAQAGSYLSSPTVNQMMGQVPGVQAPRSFGYVNPNAGYQGQQFALQNYQNALGYSQLQGGGGNPWTNALSGASTGASMGSIGGGYGMAGGAITGGILGAFGYPQYSDSKLKNNISRTGALTGDGIPIVTYEMNGRTYMGVLAQDVQEKRPDAVYTFPDGTLGVFYEKLGIELREVH